MKDLTERLSLCRAMHCSKTESRYTMIDTAVIDPAVIDPAVMDPAVIGAAVIDPAVIDLAVIFPVVIVPALIDPVVIGTGRSMIEQAWSYLIPEDKDLQNIIKLLIIKKIKNKKDID